MPSATQPPAAAGIILAGMDPAIRRIFSGRRAELQRRWAEALRAPRFQLEPAEIEACRPLLGRFVDEICRSIRRDRLQLARQRMDTSALRASCACGHNPLLACFLAGEEAVIGAGAEWIGATPASAARQAAALAEIHMILAKLADREIEAFCGGCDRHPTGTAPGPDPAGRRTPPPGA